MVELGASSNVMSYLVCKKLGLEPSKSGPQIVQLDRSKLKVLGGCKNILIRLSSDSRVHQIIDFVVAYIPEAYGLLLSRDWSSRLNGYFGTNWNHLLLPYKGKKKSNKGK